MAHIEMRHYCHTTDKALSVAPLEIRDAPLIFHLSVAHLAICAIDKFFEIQKKEIQI